ncbi:hypothetical protein OEZ85_006309 [Tetradesmus obliquus]|uniref:Guanylate cyclase domain-containing protein n=1 Tax=Tetradesmus obliquus TaxID=3088 RepID=A0ABY8TY65_TETOB|nr:hypothetical protein OEZ85_006309 [Tetradesmus obliquus]
MGRLLAAAAAAVPGQHAACCCALAAFYNSTFNPDKPWDTKPWANKQGWELTATRSCQQLLAAPARAPSYCSWNGVSCCDPTALAGKQCSAVHSVSELKVQVNGLNGTLGSPGIISNLLRLHACGLTRLNLQGNDLSGSMTPEWGLMTNLVVLDLSNNWLNGTIPAALRSLKRLQTLGLGTNFLSGPIPSWLGELTALQVLNLGASAGDNEDGSQGLTGTLPEALSQLPQLAVLNVETNALTGSIPEQLCSHNKLKVLKLRSNRLGGVPQYLTQCTELTQLDISNNRFSGPMPANMSWPQLAVLDASSNDFHGPLTPALYSLPVLGYLNLANNSLPVLGYLNLANNRFSGSIERAVTLMTFLTQLNLANNRLTGIIDENLWFLPQLRSLDLSRNNLTGSISSAIGLTFGLTDVLLGTNSLTGAIPPQMGVLQNLHEVDLRNSSMSCLGTHEDAAAAAAPPSSTADAAANATANATAVDLMAKADRDPQQCDDSMLLPCFLFFSKVTLPRIDNSNMACPVILRRPRDEAVAACEGDSASQLGEQAGNIAEVAAAQQTWDIDPSYYQFRPCRCLEGFRAVWLSNGTRLTCEAMPGTAAAWVTPVTALLCVIGVALLAAVGLFVWLRMTVQLRPRWQREKELAENRKKGVPSGGPATIVVTDIECFSELMTINAPLATRFLGIHNALLRRAAAAHAGHVIEQEGDSWSVAFHTAVDAVAFCLQVQQCLAKTNWPSVAGYKRNSGSRINLRDGAPGDVRRTSGSSTALGGDGHRRNSSSQGMSSWIHSMSAVVLGSGGSGGSVQAAAAAAAAAGSAASAPITMLRRAARDVKSANLPLMHSEGHQHQQQQQQQQQQQSASLSNLMVLREQSDSSSMSAGMLAVEGQRSPSFDLRGRAGNAFSISRGQLLQQQQLISQVAGQTPSFSVASSRSSALSMQGGNTSEPNSSIRSFLASLRSRMHSGDSLTGLVVPQRSCNSFTGGAGGAAAVSASEIQQLSGASDPVQGRSSNLSLSVPRNRTSGTMISGLTATGGPQAAVEGQQQGSASRFWSAIGFAASGDNSKSSRLADGKSIRGLRVRMGVASGYVPRNTNIARCALFELAKAVSDMANGGQVLLDACCFADVRNRLTELGTVDHKGYNDKLLASATKAAMQQHTSCLFNLLGCLRGIVGKPREAAPLETDALVLDMGEYYQPSLGPIIPSASGELANTAVDLSPSALDVDDAAVAAAAGAMVRSPAPAFQLQLYSVLPRCLQANAKVWMGQLTFREPTQQTRVGYFCAPGAGVADLSSQQQSPELERPPLPPVTMVFAAVEGGRALLRRRQDAGLLVHAVIGRLMQVALLALPERDARPDGYVCREQEGGLKFMAAFRDSARAVEWCLLVQELLSAVPWPNDVLEDYAPVAAEALGSSSSSSSSRAPVLRMGLAEGTPHSILPDHLGRADYHGPSVNLAARMMDAAAHGGLIVTSAELADRIFCTWRFEAELGLYDPPDQTAAAAAAAEGQQQPEQQQGEAHAASAAADSNVAAVASLADQEVAGMPQQQQQQQQQHMSGDLPSFDSPLEQRMEQLQGQLQLLQQQQQPPAAADGSSCSVSFLLPSVSEGIGAAGGAETPHMASPVGSAVAASAGAASGGLASAGVGSGVMPALGPQGSHGGGMKPSSSRRDLLKELMQRSMMLQDAPEYQLRRTLVSCSHIGTYAFKGCGALDMVAFSTDAPHHQLLPQGSQLRSSGKGVLLLQKDGPVVGLQDCPILLPQVLPALRQAWAAVAKKAAPVEHARVLRKQVTSPSFDMFRLPPDMRRSIGGGLGNAAGLAGSGSSSFRRRK